MTMGVRMGVERIRQSVLAFIADEILHESSSAALSADRLLLEEGILDSLALQKLVLFLEQEFALEIDDSFLTPENFATVESIAVFVDAVSNGTTP
jgi:acyl carrier protein